MSASYMPHDLAPTPESLTSDSNTASKLPSRPKNRPEKWDQLKAAAIADKDNWRKWDALFKVLEDSWSTSASKEAANATHAATKAAFSMFLSRFPYSAQHWRQFSLLQYKMAGTDESVRCLKRAVDEYPQSVSLWVEYLSALTTVETPVLESDKDAQEPQDSTKEHQTSAEKGSKDAVEPSASTPNASQVPSTSKVQDKTPISSAQKASTHKHKLRAEFARAADAIGMNFNSDPFWNKYIEFESASAENGPSKDLLKVYLRLIRIPLYQYAQYYNEFTEISKSFSVSDILDPKDLPKYLEVFGKTQPDELSVIESRQLIDTFSYDVFSRTQAHVTKKWPFEAALTIQEFSMVDRAAIEAQTCEWRKYLDAEIDAFRTCSFDTERALQYALVVSLFERALVPNCGNADLWYKYIDFVEQNAPSPEVSLDTRTTIYKKAIFTFLPLEETKMREKYGQMLLREKSFDAANDFLFDTLRLYSGITGARIYVKTAYVHELTQIFTLWAESVPETEVIRALEGLVTNYFSRVDRYKKETGHRPGAGETSGQNSLASAEAAKKTNELKPTQTASVSKYLNDDGICVVAVHLLRLLQDDPEDTSAIRKFYNRYHVEAAFSRSVQFWRFFVEFEGYKHQNLVNLRAIVKYIKTATALPKMAVDAFLDIYYEVTCANLAQAASLSGKENYLDILVTISAEKSDDLHVNRAARARIAKNNYMVFDHKNSGPSQSEEDALMKMRSKHLSHPGVFVEAMPEITNPLMGGSWISLLDDTIVPPALPTFRNLDKAAAAIHYPDE
ncbi:hypothetical protein JCM33374_g2905 [Metschnikowia sp. JCM 33374]|nr:hypothetical protein JCM33374_g2905 [Metschnikowia sp. JCM 33374]